MALTARLAPELIIRILDFVDPPSVLDLACSCRFLAECSRDILRKHRDISARYRVITDVDPRSITDALRTAMLDPGVAWHVRELEFTYARTEWSHWRRSGSEGVEDAETRGPPDWSFTLAERIELLDLLCEVLRFNERDIDAAREDLQQGNDAPLKLLLLGLCPKIRSVKFARHSHRIGRGGLEREKSSEAPETPRSSEEYLHQAVLNNVQVKSSHWPPGFQSLRELAVGVNVESDVQGSDYSPAPSVVMDLMRLPQLHSLYCFGLDVNADEDYHDDRGTEMEYTLEKGSSSVQNIFLSGAYGFIRAPYKPMLAGCKQIKSLTIACSEISDVDAVVETLGSHHREVCETLMFYDTSELSGYRCGMYRPEAMESLTNLRTVYVDASDVMLGAYYESDGQGTSNPEHEWIDDFDFFLDFFMNDAFHERMEVLVIGTQSRSYPCEGDADFFDRALATMIEYGRNDDRGGEQGDSAKTFTQSFPNLKAIYLGLDEVHLQQPRRKRWFSRTIAAGRKHGVDVHTRTTQGQPEHQIKFPKPPTMMSQGSVMAEMGSGLVFDVYKGKWRAPGCGNCGHCERCLEHYDASVWKAIEDGGE